MDQTLPSSSRSPSSRVSRVRTREDAILQLEELGLGVPDLEVMDFDRFGEGALFGLYAYYRKKKLAAMFVLDVTSGFVLLPNAPLGPGGRMASWAARKDISSFVRAARGEGGRSPWSAARG